MLARELLEEVVHEQQEVGLALPQGRHEIVKTLSR
jgi:hypothetical protein